MSSKHPNLRILKQFANGDLDEHLSILISAHRSGCKKCSKIVSESESKASLIFFNEVDSRFKDLKIPDFSAIQAKILNKKSTVKEASILQTHKDKHLVFKNKNIDLPAPLIALKKLMGPWKSINKNISYSKLSSQSRGNLYFVFFGPGAKIPEHSHDGNEYAYVVAGSFRDQVSEYISGDFASFNHKDCHHPYTDDPDGCMLLVNLKGPFYFKEGLARLLNPFRHFIFKYF
ncbi:MAG: cupin domain-containing protein [Bdellovibrionaceae bacterium]|nr:cupin domain-containing protein [Pseudobdellovibrionaceae bacterium]